MNGGHQYANISQTLGPWLDQFDRMDPLEYVALRDEMRDAEGHHEEYLNVLDSHLAIAAEVCHDFSLLVSEKRRLPSDIQEANKLILDKLAEVRAVVGLHKLGFVDIRFAGSPDLEADHQGVTYAVEITRLGASVGKRADVWDKEWTVVPGLEFGIMGGDKLTDALSDALYRETEAKYAQMKKHAKSQSYILWVSLGRDYLTAGKYELPGVGVSTKMPRTIGLSLRRAFELIKATGAYESLRYMILSPGREKTDLIYPQIEGSG